MRKLNRISKMVLLLLCLLAAINSAACSKESRGDSNDDSSGSPPAETSPFTTDVSTPVTTNDEPFEATTSVPDPTPVPTPEAELFEYDGVVEHIFFHEVIAWPELAFDGDSRQPGYSNNMVTVTEFTKILDSIYKNGYILISLNDVWSEVTNDNGEQKMQKNNLMLPEGKKPIVISFDDLCFYNYMLSDGFMRKYIVGEDGDIWAAGVDPQGNHVISQDMTVVTILDKFVREHPDFSLNGTKGCIAFTGYEGILGYRTHTDKKDNSEQFRQNRIQEIARVRPVIKRLKETGWYFASHSFGHIDIANDPFEKVKADADRWIDEVGSLIGETKIFIYPFGARLDGGDVNNTGPAFKYYHSLGFRIFASVGPRPFSKIKTDIAAVILDRMNSDGYTIRSKDARERFLRFYDSAEVIDPRRPA